jgi:hypothetical protein
MELLLRRDNPSQRMPPGQHDAAMIDLDTRSARVLQLRRNLPLDNCPSARRAPVSLHLLAHYGMALTANPLHIEKITPPALVL